MKIDIIKARVLRNKLNEYAGEFYRDNDSKIVQELNRKNNSAFLGIQRDDGIYTILGESFVYFLTPSKVKGKISNKDFQKILGDNIRNVGKAENFEFIKINDKDSLWVKSTETMFALWNTIQMFN